MRRALAPVDIPLLLTRLGIKSSRRGGSGRYKHEAHCPRPTHQSNPHAWYIREDPGAPHHGWHACQSCGFKGGVVALVCEVFGWDVRDEDDRRRASEWLGDLRAPRPIPVRIDREVLPVAFGGLREPPGVLRSGWPKAAVDYLANRRIGPMTCARWRLGFVPGNAAPWPDPTKRFHRLQRRVFVPLLDGRGRLLSYTARAWFDTDKRYLEPREEERASTGAVFGELHWGDVRGFVVVCEGAFDAMAVDQAGEGRWPVAALAGSNPSPAQIGKLSSFGHVYLLNDPDNAGKKSNQILRETLARHCATTEIKVPVGTDPAKLWQDQPAFLISLVGGILETT